ncbi:MAG: glycosyltransferase family 4 protein [Lachnospira sp.]
MSYEGFIKFAEKNKNILIKAVPKEVWSKAKTELLYKQSLKADYNFVKYNAGAFKNGVNLYGDVDSISGLGESARILTSVINRAGIPCAVQRFHVTGAGEAKEKKYRYFDSRLTEKQMSGKQKPQYGVNIFDISPGEMPLAYMKYGKGAFDRHYNIGYWVWELETLPKLWIRSFDMVDEIWTPSEYSREILMKYTDKPVITVPHAISVTPDESSDRVYFQLPEGVFLFMMVYDCRNQEGRKNSNAAIKAFMDVADKCNAHLVIKLNGFVDNSMRKSRGGGKESGIYSEINRNSAISDRIHLIYQELSNTEMNSLINCCDSFISLHRAEGFGLVIAEAMSLGKPVIATGFSGNLEYMTRENSCMTDYGMISVGKGNAPFVPKDRWAEADVSQAGEYMLKLISDKEYYNGISENAKQSITENLCTDRISVIVKERLEHIYRGKDKV